MVWFQKGVWLFDRHDSLYKAFVDAISSKFSPKIPFLMIFPVRGATTATSDVNIGT